MKELLWYYDFRSSGQTELAMIMRGILSDFMQSVVQQYRAVFVSIESHVIHKRDAFVKLLIRVSVAKEVDNPLLWFLIFKIRSDSWVVAKIQTAAFVSHHESILNVNNALFLPIELDPSVSIMVANDDVFFPFETFHNFHAGIVAYFLSTDHQVAQYVNFIIVIDQTIPVLFDNFIHFFYRGESSWFINKLLIMK